MRPALGPREATRSCKGGCGDLPLLEYSADPGSPDGYADRCDRCRSGAAPRQRPALHVVQAAPAETCRDPHLSDAIALVRKTRGQLADDRAAVIFRRAGRVGRSPQAVCEEIAYLQARVEDLDMVLRVLEILRRELGTR